MKKERYSVIGDLTASSDECDVSNIYRNHSERGLKEDERIFMNWRVVENETGRTMCVFGGGAGHDAALVFKDHCEANYRI